MKIQGHYINLDSSTDRRRLIEENLAQEGMSEYFSRFAARRGDSRSSTITPSELGCYLSHQIIIQDANIDAHTFILEDDAILPQHFKHRFFQTFHTLLDQSWDILFLCQVVPFQEIALLADLIATMEHLNQRRLQTRQPQYALLNADTHYRWGTAGYIIRAGAQTKIKECIERDCADGYRQPIDGLYHHAVRDGRINAKCIFPYQVGIRDIATTIPDRSDALEHYFHSMLVNVFVDGMHPTTLYEKALKGFDEPPLNGPVFVISQMHYRVLLDLIEQARIGP